MRKLGCDISTIGVLVSAILLTTGLISAAETPLRYCGDAGLMPLDYFDPMGQPQGFNVEVVREVSRRTGIPIEIRLGVWQDMVDAFARGECHLMALGYTEERAAKHQFLGQVRLANQVIVFPGQRKDPPRRLDQLGAEVIAVQRDSYNRIILSRLPEAQRPKLVEVEGHEAILRALMAGTATAGAGNEIVIRRWAHKLGLQGGIHLVPVRAFSIHLVGTASNVPGFAQMRSALEDMRVDETLERFEDEFVNGRTSLRVLKVSAGIVAAIVIIVLLVLLWNRSLRREVVRRTEELTLAKAAAEKAAEQMRLSKDAAEKAASAKSDFLATMSHELRTPLNGVLGMASLLSDSNLTAEQQECTATIQAAGQSLLVTINDILDISKIAAGQLSLESIPFRLGEVVRQVIDILAPQVNARGIRLAAACGHWEKQQAMLDTEDYLVGDPVRIRQILMNLANNGVKFTEQGSVLIEYGAAIVSETRAKVRIRVVDTGIGIPEEFRDRLFDPFTQADLSTTRKFGGTGLGLSISKRLVEAMGGVLGVSSVVGEGSTFWVELELPRSAADERTPLARVATSVAPPPTGRRRILVADDNPVNQIVALRMLERLGYECKIAANGEQAVDALSSDPEPYDLILMDCQMPVMDGYAATAAIRALGANLPIIAMTANALPGDEERCLRAGMDGYLAKPVQLTELRELLASCLAKVPWHALTELSKLPSAPTKNRER